MAGVTLRQRPYAVAEQLTSLGHISLVALAGGLEEPQEGQDRAQLHSFKKQMISQWQQAAHNAIQDHIRLRTEPFLDLQRRDDEHGGEPFSSERAHQPLHPDQATDQALDRRPMKCYGHSIICAVE